MHIMHITNQNFWIIKKFKKLCKGCKIFTHSSFLKNFDQQICLLKIIFEDINCFASIRISNTTVCTVVLLIYV